ncbi:MAG TPA: hypothetical protein ENH82_04775 [bacterium]|nr:hypothetical protein [bacterium]
MKPILMTVEMAKATLDGRKTQTRRVCKTQSTTNEKPYLRPDGLYIYTLCNGVGTGYPFKCPYGKIGDRLYVRETHYRFGKWVKNGISKTGKQRWKFKATHDYDIRYYDNPPPNIRSNSYRKIGWYQRPSIFMPKWASRIKVDITDIRIGRVQDITVEDCLKEGIEMDSEYASLLISQAESPYDCRAKHEDIEKMVFENLWDSINLKRGYGWRVNPFIWVVEFKIAEVNK